MRIALTASLVAPIRAAEANGPHSVILDLARGLAQRGHGVAIFAAAGSSVSEPGVQLIEIPVDAIVAQAAIRADGTADDSAQRALADGFRVMFGALREYGVDAVSQHAFDAPAFDLSAELPIAHTLHLPPIDPNVVAAAARSEAPLVCVSRASADDWRGAGLDNLTVVRNGIPDPGIAATRAETPPFALVAGRVSPEKGTAVAVRSARAAGLDVRVVGDVYDRRYFDEAVRPLIAGDVVTPLPRGELAHLMARAAVIVMPIAWQETFGLVAAEAQMVGCPVVAYARGALTEIVLEGVSGFLVEPDDEQALVRAIPRALLLDRAAIAAGARQSFGIEPMIDAYEALLERVAG